MSDKKPDPTVHKSILFVRPGEMKPNDKGRLFSVGVLVVEVDRHPSDVRLLTAETFPDLPRSALLRAAGRAIAASPTAQTAFGKALADEMAGVSDDD